MSSLNNDHVVKYLPKPISLSCHDLTLLEGLPFQQFCKLKLQTHLWLWQSYLHLNTKVSFLYFCSDKWKLVDRKMTISIICSTISSTPVFSDVCKCTGNLSNKLLLKSFCRQAIPKRYPQRLTVSDKFRNELCIVFMQKDCLELII